MFKKKVNYIKEALTEPINIWTMVGFASTAAYMQHWIPLAAGLAAETLYLVTVPAHSAYRRLVDRRERQRQLKEAGEQREAIIKGFDPREREAVEYLRWMKQQIYSDYRKFSGMDAASNPNFAKLETAWESFVDLLDMYRRRKNHLRSINRQAIQNQLQQVERQMSNADDYTRGVMEKNLNILRLRLRTYDDIERSVRRVEAELQSIENFFGLVRDQVVTMTSPEGLASIDFESLLSSIEITRQVLEETAPVLSAIDSFQRDNEATFQPPPPVAQRQ
jgi:hypothetical protein